MKKEEYFRRLDLAIRHIEDNLHEKLSTQEISKKAFSSLSHFHRIFSFMTGMNLKEYIRARRLSVAAKQILESKGSILEIALEAGFESHESFTRAFKKFFGKNPSEFRKNHDSHKVQSRIDVYRDYATCPEIPKFLSVQDIQRKELTVWGAYTETTLQNEQQTIDIPKFIGEQMKRSCFQEQAYGDLFGVYTNMTHKEEFTYFMGKAFNEKLAKQESLQSALLPAGLYACFTVHGDFKNLREAWSYIYGSWMPHSGRARRNGFDFEIYFPEKTEIYIPITEE